MLDKRRTSNYNKRGVRSVKNILKNLGFSKFKWFRKWYGGPWFIRCSLRYALQNGILIKDKKAYIAKDFSVIYDIEEF